jgi:hypothetical protein
MTPSEQPARARRVSFLARGVGIALAFGIASALPGFSQGLETYPLLADAFALYDAAGLARPTVSLPVSRSEVRGMLHDLAREDVPPEVASEARRRIADLRATGAEPEILVDFTLMPEYYLNLDRSQFAEQIRTEDPFASLTLGYGLPSGAYLLIEAALQREWTYGDAPTNIPRPVPGNPLPFENNLVRQGYLFLPIGAVDVTFGRQPISLGPDSRNTLSVSSSVPFLDALKVTTTMGDLKMTSVASTLENGAARLDPDSVSGDLYDFGINTILYNIHYFEYAWPRVRVGVGSQVVIARPMNNFQLGDFFPVFSWHNADFTPNNMSLLADVTVAPLPHLLTFVQVGFDDISGEGVGISDSAIPTIDAYVAGVRGRLPAYGLEASLVGGYTHYLWGAFNDGEYLSRAIYRVEADGPRRSMPLTSPHGPGALWIDAEIAGEFRDLTGSLRYVATGVLPGADLYTVPYAVSPAIEGASRRWTHELSFATSYAFDSIGRVSVSPGIVFGDVAPRMSLEIAGQLRYRLERSVSE